MKYDYFLSLRSKKGLAGSWQMIVVWIFAALLLLTLVYILMRNNDASLAQLLKLDKVLGMFG